MVLQTVEENREVQKVLDGIEPFSFRRRFTIRHLFSLSLSPLPLVFSLFLSHDLPHYLRVQSMEDLAGAAWTLTPRLLTALTNTRSTSSISASAHSDELVIASIN